MPFPESFLQELTDRNEISEVVSGYVRLSKKSGANLFGLCPFHSEKTPSFSVSTDRQIYHCFGCGKGGGVINFIMEIENLSYPDAVRFLARRVGLAVPEEEQDENYSRRERMLSLNRDAARFFYEQLKDPGGQIARDYIKKREISPVMAKNFGLGFAPNSWDSLVDAMQKKGYTKPELLSAGLARASKNGSGGVYDTFRNRLMFPVIDVRGSVIGFSGRILDDGEPKYMNSPETIVFNKSRNLFALNLAKKSKKGYIILSEGNVDVVSLHQAGFDCAVASLGTSLTPEQARLISRYTTKVVITYDGDSAGQKASQRAINIFGKVNVKVSLVRLFDAKDPDEYIKKFGAPAFENLINKAEKSKDYLLMDIITKYDLSNDSERISFLKEATNYIAGFWNDIERGVYCQRLAEMTKIKEDVIIQEVERLNKIKSKSAKRTEAQEESKPIKMNQPKNKELRFENIRSAKAEKGVIGLLYYEPSLFSDCELQKEDFSSQILGRFYEEILSRAKKGSQPSLAPLSEFFSNAEIALLTELVSEPIELSNAEKALSDYINIIKTEKLAREQSGEGQTDLRGFAEKMRQSKGYGG